MMRLTHINVHGDLALECYRGSQVPAYAVLSHCWSAGERNVYEDIEQGKDINHEITWRKIRFCHEKAAEQALDHCWIDSACVDWRSSAELSETINSACQWFKSATICFVLLDDVDLPADAPRDLQSLPSKTRQQFRDSRWFTRGWTLQELLVPKKIQFYSRHGQLLGDKVSLQEDIEVASGVPIEAFSGAKSLSEFSVDERLSWAARRQCINPEDEAYSLLGIFDVFMSVRYGEGRENAMLRLLEKIEQQKVGESTFRHRRNRWKGRSSEPAALNVDGIELPALDSSTAPSDERSAQSIQPAAYSSHSSPPDGNHESSGSLDPAEDASTVVKSVYLLQRPCSMYSLLLVAVVMISFAISISLSVLKDDAGSGFTVGAFTLASGGLLVNEMRGRHLKTCRCSPVGN